jgi:hypothetical protein
MLGLFDLLVRLIDLESIVVNAASFALLLRQRQ